MLKFESIGHFSALLLIAVLCSVTKSHAILPSHGYRTLKPAQRSTLDFRREELVQSFLPRSPVILEYRVDEVSTAQASVLIEAHGDKPILLLEALAPSLVYEVTCQSFPSNINVTLASEALAQALMHTWAPNVMTSLYVITSHPGCNADNSRGAWSVNSIVRRAQSIVLFVSPLPLREVGKTFDISFRHTGITGGWGTPSSPSRSKIETTLEGRDFESTSNTTYDHDLSGMEIFPGNSSSLGLASNIIQQLSGASVAITCADCTSHFNFTVGVDFTLTAGAGNVSKALIFANVNRFEQSVLLDIKVEENLQVDFEFDLLKVPVDGFEIPGLFSIGPFIGLGVQFNFTLTDEVDFQVGANASIPANANATVDLINPSNSIATGWDGAAFQVLPLRMNSGAPNFTIGAALAPFLSFDINVGGGGNGTEVGLEARLSQTTPSIEFDFVSHSNVTSACRPPGDADFSFFSTAYTVGSTLGLTTSAGVELNDAGIFETLGLDVASSWSTTLFQYEINLPLSGKQADTNVTCFVLAADGGSSIDRRDTSPPTATQHPASTGTLLAAASAIPTYDMSKIQSYYSSHGNTLPPGITFQDLASSGQQIPDTIKESNATPLHATTIFFVAVSSALIAAVLI